MSGFKTPNSVLIVTTDDEGRKVFGEGNGGCPYYGRVNVKFSTANDAVWYHASVLCCEPRVRWQHELRLADQRAIFAEMNAYDRKLQEL